MPLSKLVVLAAILLPAGSALADGPSPAGRLLANNPALKTTVSKAITIQKSPQYGQDGRGQAIVRVQQGDRVSQVRVGENGQVMKGSEKFLGAGNLTQHGNYHDQIFGDTQVLKANGESIRLIKDPKK